jgi:hypothetical protein
MSYDRRLMIKQHLGEIPANKTHPRLEVFTSGVPDWYVFAPMVAPGISGTIQFPVKGSDLKTGWQTLLE